MKSFLIGVLTLLAHVSYAQQPPVTVSQGAGPNDYNVDWDGVAGRFYTLQVSVDMQTWVFCPVIEYGAGPHAYGFTTTVPNGTFIRLQYQDIALSNPLTDDIDGDGLTNQEEIFTYGTSPFNSDTDGDGIDDEYETGTGFLNPLDPSDAFEDPDGDNLVNLWESRLGLSPPNVGVENSDNDGDGLINNAEIYLSTSQNLQDTDGNGILDPDEDADGDNLTNIVEFGIHGTDPRDPDTDNDSLPDGWELQYSFNPHMGYATGPMSATADPDGDGLTNQEESDLGTNPNNPDTDSDGVDDKTERDQGTDPLDPDDSMPPPEGTMPVTITFGDPQSSSSSEKYRLFLRPLEGDTMGERFRTNQQFGVPRTVTFRLPKGAKYEVELKHFKTNRIINGQKIPEFDHIIEPMDKGNCWAIRDPDDLIGRGGADNVEDLAFGAKGKKAFLHVPLFEWITPKESPVTAPDDSGDGQNEFTYDSAMPGVLSINELKILVKPTGTAGLVDYDGIKFADRCVYDLPAISSSMFMWDTANPGGMSNASGENLVARATYTNLPINNSEFGLKQAEFECDGNIPEEIDPFGGPGQEGFGEFEVFFTKTADNHPGTGPFAIDRHPNWLYYWRDGNGDVCGIPANTQYDLTASYGYVQPSLDSIIRLGPLAPETNSGPETYTGASPYGSITVTGQGKGTQCVAETVAHELHHITLFALLAGRLDNDNDEIADVDESTLDGINSDPADPDTYNMGGIYATYGDNEIRCRKKELNPGIVVHPDRDWANPGSQSLNKFGP